jgi:hypothetical protein
LCFFESILTFKIYVVIFMFKKKEEEKKKNKEKNKIINYFSFVKNKKNLKFNKKFKSFRFIIKCTK